MGHGVGQAGHAVIDKTDHPAADVLMLGQVFGQAHAVFGGTQNDGLLQEDPAAHQAFEQGQQNHPLDPEQQQAAEVPHQ